jgi:hypothetical protein
VDDTAAFQNELSYAKLQVSRSPREVDVISRMQLLDRRICELIGDENKGLTSSYHPRDPTKFILTQGVECPSTEQLKAWLDAMAEDLKKVEGWTRTRMYKCFSNLTSGLEIGNNKEDQKVPEYLVIHGE